MALETEELYSYLKRSGKINSDKNEFDTLLSSNDVYKRRVAQALRLSNDAPDNLRIQNMSDFDNLISGKKKEDSLDESSQPTEQPSAITEGTDQVSAEPQQGSVINTVGEPAQEAPTQTFAAPAPQNFVQDAVDLKDLRYKASNLLSKSTGGGFFEEPEVVEEDVEVDDPEKPGAKKKEKQKKFSFLRKEDPTVDQQGPEYGVDQVLGYKDNGDGTYEIVYFSDKEENNFSKDYVKTDKTANNYTGKVGDAVYNDYVKKSSSTIRNYTGNDEAWNDLNRKTVSLFHGMSADEQAKLKEEIKAANPDWNEYSPTALVDLALTKHQGQYNLGTIEGLMGEQEIVATTDENAPKTFMDVLRGTIKKNKELQKTQAKSLDSKFNILGGILGRPGEGTFFAGINKRKNRESAEQIVTNNAHVDKIDEDFFNNINVSESAQILSSIGISPKEFLIGNQNDLKRLIANSEYVQNVKLPEVDQFGNPIQYDFAKVKELEAQAKAKAADDLYNKLNEDVAYYMDLKYIEKGIETGKFRQEDLDHMKQIHANNIAGKEAGEMGKGYQADAQWAMNIRRAALNDVTSFYSASAYLKTDDLKSSGAIRTVDKDSKRLERLNKKLAEEESKLGIDKSQLDINLQEIKKNNEIIANFDKSIKETETELAQYAEVKDNQIVLKSTEGSAKAQKISEDLTRLNNEVQKISEELKQYYDIDEDGLRLKDGVDENKAQDLLDLINQKVDQLDKLEGELQPYLDKNEKGESYIKNENSDKVNEILAKQKQLIEERNKIVESSKSLGGDADKLQKFYDDHKEDYEEIAFLSSRLNTISQDKGFSDLKSIKATIDNLDVNLKENPQYSVVSGGYSGAYAGAKVKEDEWNSYLKESAREDGFLESTVKTIVTANKGIGEGLLQTYNVIESVFTDDSNTWDEVDANMQNTQFRKTRWSEMAVNPYLEEYSGMWWYSNVISQVPNLLYNVGASMAGGAVGVITYNFLAMEGDMVKQFEDAGYDKGLAMLYGTLTAGTLAAIEALVPELPDAVGITIKKNSAGIISKGLADGLSAQQISKALLANAYEVSRNAGFKIFSQSVKEAGEEMASGVVESTIMNLAEIKNDTLPEAAKEVLVQGAVGALIGLGSASAATTAEVISEKSDKNAGLKFMQLEVGKNGKEILAQAEKRNADVKDTDQYKDFQKINNTYKELEKVVPFKKAGDLAKAEILDLFIQKESLVKAVKEAEKLGVVDVESMSKIEEIDNKILTAFNADEKRRESSSALVNSLAELGVVSYSMNQDGTVKEVNFAPEVSGGMVEENLPKAKELINAQLLKAREEANKQKQQEDALQKSSTTEVLPGQPQKAGEAGSERTGMESSLEGQGTTKEGGEKEVVRDEAWDENAIANLPESSFPDRKSFKEMIKNGVFGMLTAWNPQRKSLSDEENAKRNEAAKAWLEERGYSTDGIFGKYGNSEMSFFVPNLSREDAIAFAKEFDQESVATHDALVYQDGSYHPRIKGAEKFDIQSDFYSVMNIAGKRQGFSIEYDFDTLFDKDGNKIETSNQENTQATEAETLEQANATGYNISDSNRAKELSKLAKTPYQKRIVDQAVKALKTLKSILPNWDIIVFDNENDFANYAQSVKANADARGLFTTFNGNGVIAINLQAANLRTVAHEMTHAVLFKMFGDNPKLFAQFKSKIAELAKGKKIKAIDENGVEMEISLDEFAESLASDEAYDDVDRAEEYMSELTAVLSQLKESDPNVKSFLKSVAEYINQLIAKYFGPDLKPIDDTSSPEEIMEFFQTFANKVYYGQEINVQESETRESKYNSTKAQVEKLFKQKTPVFKSLIEISNYIENWVSENKLFDDNIENVSDKEVVKKFSDHILKEINAWSEIKGSEYIGFYDQDIPDRLNPELQKFAKERYGRELTNEEISLYHIVSAFASPSADPEFDSSKGLEVFDKYMTTGKLSGYSGEQATIWEMGPKGRYDTGKPKFDEQGNVVYKQIAKAYAVDSLEKFNKVLEHFNNDIAKAVNWVLSKHTYEEVSNIIGTPTKGPKAITENEYFDKKNGGMGVFGITGVKLGSYILNRVGDYSTVTKDMWYARTLARLAGESLSEKGKALTSPWALTKAGLRKRKLADEAFAIVAKKLNSSPADVQQKIWDFEKRLYEKLGSIEKASYASDGFKKKAKELSANQVNIKSKAQAKTKAGESLVDQAKLTKHMTEDGQGNYLFYHYSPNKISSIDPKYFGKNTARTGRDEKPGLNISMYYTRPDVLDVSGKYGYVVRIPKDLVYPFNEDPLNLYDAAKASFDKMYPGQTFDPNKQAAFIAQEAAKIGYPMTVVKWGKDLRAETTEKMKGEFYQRPDKEYPSAVEYNPALEMFEANEEVAKKNKNLPKSKAQIIGTIGAARMKNAKKLMYDLDVARIMEKEGKSKEEIRIQTNWERGADDHWRIEAPDGNLKMLVSDEDLSNIRREIFGKIVNDAIASGKSIGEYIAAKISGGVNPTQELLDSGVDKVFKGKFDNPKKPTVFRSKLTDIFDAPEIYKAYGNTEDWFEGESGHQQGVKRKYSIKDIIVEFDPEYSSLEASMNLANNNAKPILTLSSRDALKPSVLLSNIIHEVQHYIQMREFFEGGANPDDMFDMVANRLDYLRDKLSEAENDLESTRSWNKDLNYRLKKGGITEVDEYINQGKIKEQEDQKKIDLIKKQIDDIYSSIESSNKRAGNNRLVSLSSSSDNMYQYYFSVAGEVEARNAAKRSTYSADEKMAETLESTEDIAREDQLLLRQSRMKSKAQAKSDKVMFNAWGKPVEINLNNITVSERERRVLNSGAETIIYKIDHEDINLGYIEIQEKNGNYKIALSGLYNPIDFSKPSSKPKQDGYKYDGPIKPIIDIILKALSKIFPKGFKGNVILDEKDDVNKIDANNYGKGIGSKAYGLLAQKLKEEYGKTLVSDVTRSDAAEALWRSLERKGLARVVGDRENSKNRWAYYYEYVVPETSVKSKAQAVNKKTLSYDETLAEAGLTEADVKQWKEKNKVDNKQKRNPDVQEAAVQLKEGKIKPSTFIDIVRKNMPIIPILSVPKLPTIKEITSSLATNKVEIGIVGLNVDLQDGTEVGLRLDIPAYKDYDTWVVSIHESAGRSIRGKSIGYGQTGVVRNVTFGVEPLAALNIATGKEKTTIARIYGAWVNESPESVHARAEELMNDPNWVQVGMNPFRHSFFYDKADGMPVVSAEEVVQVGALVLAKNVVKGTPEDSTYELTTKEGVTTKFQMKKADKLEYVLLLDESANKVKKGAGILNTLNDLIAKVRKIKGFRDMSAWKKREFEENIERDLKNKLAEEIAIVAKIYSEMDGSSKSIAIEKAFADATKDGMEFFTVDELKDAVNAQWDKINKAELKARRGDERPDVFKLKEKLKELRAELSQTKEDFKQAKKAEKDKRNSFRYFVKEYLKLAKLSGLNSQQISAIVNRATGAVTSLTDKQIDNFMQYVDKIVANKEFAAKMDALASNRKTALKRRHNEFTEDVLRFLSIPLFDTDNNPLLTDAEMDRYLDAVAGLAKAIPDHSGLDMSLADKAFSADLGKKEFETQDYTDALTEIKSMPINTLEEYTAFVRAINKAKRILDSLYNQGLIDATTHEQWASGDLYTIENGLRVYEDSHQDQIDILKEGLTDDLFQKIANITTSDLFIGEQKSLFEKLRSLSPSELMNLDVKDLLKLNEALDRMEYGFMPEKEVREMVNRVEIRSQKAGSRIVNQLGDIYTKLTKGVNLLMRKLSSEEAAQWEDVLGLKEGDALYQYVVAPIDRSFKKMSDKVNQILDSYYKKTADLSFSNRRFLFLKDRVKTAKGSVNAKKYFKYRVGILSHILDSGHKAYQYNENTNDWLGNQLGENSVERSIYDEEGVLNIVEDVYNNLLSNPAFVTNGKLDYRKIYEAYINDPSSLMSESEQKLYAAFREANRTSGELVINANAVRGINGELTEFFSPRRYIGKGISEDSNVELGYGGAVGGTVRSQSSYSRVSKDPAGPLQFNVDSLVANNAFESARDFYISNAISYVNEVFRNAREAARAEGRDADIKTLNALQQSNRNRVDHQLSRSANNFLTKLTKSFAAKLLIGVGRTMAETLTNIGSGIFRTLSLRGFDPKSYREAKNLMDKFSSPVANLNWDFKVKVTTKKGNLTKNTFSQQLENTIASLHNLTAPLTPGEWMSYFRAEFKRLTGEDYSESKHFDDNDYKYDLDRAASFADQRIQSIKGGSFKGQARTNYRWLPDIFTVPKMALTGKGSKSDVGKGLVSSNDTIAQMLNLFNNFVYRDVSNMLYGAKRAGRGITKDDRMNKGADLGRGLFKVATSSTSLTMYVVIFAAVKGIQKAYFSDDDKEKKEGEETLEMFTNPDKMWKMIASMGINLAANVTTSRYGASGRAMAISLLQFARNMKGAERQPIDEVLQSLYFTEGIDFEKYDAVEKYAALAFATSVPPFYMLLKEAQKLYKDYLDEPGHNKATIYDLWEEGGKLFNEETADLNKMLSAAIMATNLILAIDGKQIPFSRDFIKSLQDEVAIQQDVVILSSDGKYNLVAGVLNFDQNGVGVLSVQDNSKFVSAEKRKERSEALTQEATSMFKNYIQDELKNNRYALRDRNDEGKYAVIKFLAEKAKFDAKKKLKYDVDPADYPKLNFENLTFLEDVAAGKFLEGFYKEEYDQEVSDYIAKSIEADSDYMKYQISEAGGQQALERYYYDMYQYDKKLTNVKPIKTNYFKIIDNKIESK